MNNSSTVVKISDEVKSYHYAYSFIEQKQKVAYQTDYRLIGNDS